MNVKKLIVVAGASLGILALLRRFGPVLRERAMAKCQEILNRMPDDFPPKRMMRGIDEIEIQEQNSRNGPLEEPVAVAVASERR